ncbi:MAG: hypothetical protein DRP95_03835, partial [Candidatus Latescibacterota bacterium]
MLSREGVSGAVLADPANIRYLCGFSGEGILAVGEEFVLVTDPRYGEQAEEEAENCRVVVTREKLLDGLKEALKDGFWEGKVGFEEGLPFGTYRRLCEVFPKVEWTSLKDLEGIRKIKDEDEVACIREAARIGDRIFREVISLIRPGVSEREVAAELVYRLHREGEGPAFDPIVAFGPRSSMPHARPSDRRLEGGEVVLLDFGALFKGYASDLTRTFWIGEPDEEFVKVYGIVLDAQMAALEAAVPGMGVVELDGVARKVIEEAGYGEYFGHGLGHGVGLRVHEPPKVSPKGEGELEDGMVFTIEPGIYLPGSIVNT